MTSAVNGRPRLVVIGAGAIGLYYGAKIARAGGDVHFLLRSDLAVVQRNGITIRGLDEDFSLPRVNSYTRTADVGVCDIVLISVKTTSNADLLALLPHVIGEHTLLVTLQNGLGNEEFLAGHFGAHRILGGLCFVCLIRVAPGVVESYDSGHVRLGAFDPEGANRIALVADQFKTAGLSCSETNDLATERWRKLVWNIPFNGLAVTACGLDTEQILADHNLRAQTRALMREVVDAAKACGHALDEAVIEQQIARTETMGPYKPSTLLDFEAGRPLELDAIWGEPLRRANAAGAHAPRMEELYRQLRHLNINAQPERALHAT